MHLNHLEPLLPLKVVQPRHRQELQQRGMHLQPAQEVERRAALWISQLLTAAPSRSFTLVVPTALSLSSSWLIRVHIWWLIPVHI